METLKDKWTRIAHAYIKYNGLDGKITEKGNNSYIHLPHMMFRNVVSKDSTYNYQTEYAKFFNKELIDELVKDIIKFICDNSMFDIENLTLRSNSFRCAILECRLYSYILDNYLPMLSRSVMIKKFYETKI